MELKIMAKILREYYSVSVAKSDKKYLRSSLSKWIPIKYQGSIPVADRKGALMWAYAHATTTPMWIDKEQDIEDKYGDIESHSKVIGVVKAVTRKSGRVVVFYNVPTDTSQDEYMADLTPQGTLKNKRPTRD